MNEMRFQGGPLDGCAYVLVEGLWRFAGDGCNNFVVLSQRQVELVPVGPFKWRGWTLEGKVELGWRSADSTFEADLPDGRSGVGGTPQEAVDHAK